MSAKEWIDQLGLEPHPEGGYYKRTYCSKETFQGNLDIDPFPAGRPHSTAILYLMEAGDFAAFHRIKSDELWHFHAGGPVDVFILKFDGGLEVVRIGAAAAMQVVVPANHWFAAAPAHGTDFCLVGCTVSPGFDFRDHEMISAAELINEYPGQTEIIRRFCRS